MKRVIIAGGRKFNTPTASAILRKKCDELYLAMGEEWIVLCGMALGADLLGHNWAVDRGIKIEEHPAEWDKYGKAAGFKRNTDMVDIADLAILFWDGHSRGTADTLNKAIQRDLETFIVRYTDSQINPGTIVRRTA